MLFFSWPQFKPFIFYFFFSHDFFLSYSLSWSSELFLLWSEWEIFHVSSCQPVVRKGQQQVQPVRPGKLQEAHSCPKQRDAFNLLCSCIRSQIHSWRGGVSSWKSGSTTHGQFPCVHMRMQSCLDTMTEQVCMPCVSYLYVLLWSAGGCTKHFLCSM